MAQVYNRIFDEKKYEKVNSDNKNIIEDYIMELKSQKKSNGTILQYKNDLRIFAIYCLDKCDNKSFLNLSKRDIRNFVLYCSDNWNMSNARVNRIMSSIRTILSFAEDDDEEYEDYDRNVAAKIKGLPKEVVREVTFIPDDVILKLWQKLMDEKRYKEATLLGILYDSGCRKNEILQVERASIKEDGNASNPVRGKRGKVFKVLYFRLTKEAFKEYDKERKDSCPLLFVTSTGTPATSTYIYDIVIKWKDDLKELTGDTYNLNVHSLRHCFIENLANGTHYLSRELKLGALPLQKIKVLAHHSDVSTTDSYRSNDEERDIEELFGIKL